MQTNSSSPSSCTMEILFSSQGQQLSLISMAPSSYRSDSSIKHRLSHSWGWSMMCSGRSLLKKRYTSNSSMAAPTSQRTSVTWWILRLASRRSECTSSTTMQTTHTPFWPWNRPLFSVASIRSEVLSRSSDCWMSFSTSTIRRALKENCRQSGPRNSPTGSPGTGHVSRKVATRWMSQVGKSCKHRSRTLNPCKDKKTDEKKAVNNQFKNGSVMRSS